MRVETPRSRWIGSCSVTYSNKREREETREKEDSDRSCGVGGGGRPHWPHGHARPIRLHQGHLWQSCPPGPSLHGQRHRPDQPKTYVNVGATAMGRVTHLYVKEGDHVKKGEVVATIENVQQGANVEGQKAAIDAAKTDISSYIAAEKTAQANLEKAQADLEQKKLDYNRYISLYNDKRSPSRTSTRRSPPMTWMSPLSPRIRRPSPRPRRRPSPHAPTCRLRLNLELRRRPAQPDHRRRALRRHRHQRADPRGRNRRRRHSEYRTAPCS